MTFFEKHFGGHFDIGPITVFGFNALLNNITMLQYEIF